MIDDLSTRVETRQIVGHARVKTVAQILFLHRIFCSFPVAPVHMNMYKYHTLDCAGLCKLLVLQKVMTMPTCLPGGGGGQSIECFMHSPELDAVLFKNTVFTVTSSDHVSPVVVQVRPDFTSDFLKIFCLRSFTTWTDTWTFLVVP